MVKRILAIIKRFLGKIYSKFSPTFRKEVETNLYVKKDLQTLINKQDYLFWISQNEPGELLSETKKRVFANLPPAEGVLRDIQKLAFILLEELDKICKENDINYFVMGGTIIGSVRHKGFIPWDDDVDIGMMRKDYDKLRLVLEENDKLEILEFYNLNNYYRIPKVVLRGSKTKLAMDIILFDYSNFEDYNLPANASLETKYTLVWKKQMKIRRKYVRRLKWFKLSNMDVHNTDLIHKAEHYEKATEITQKYIDMCNYHYDDGDVIIWGVDNFTSKAPDKRRLYTKESIFPLCEIEFEGKMFPAPADYMDMIVREAGDIWTFPNDVGNPKFFNEKQLQAEYDKSYESMKKLGLISEE